MLTTVCGIGALVLIWLLYPKPFDYPGAVKDSLTFMQVCTQALPCDPHRVVPHCVAC